MASGIFDSPLVGIVNKLFVSLIDAPIVGPLVRRGMINIRYVGRRSGKTIQTPVGYRRSGDTIVINVMSPDNKTWWRNFLGEGGPITLLRLDGQDRTGHATAGWRAFPLSAELQPWLWRIGWVRRVRR